MGQRLFLSPFLILAPKPIFLFPPPCESFMKRECDFSKGERGPVAPSEPGKIRITIRLDNQILDHFRQRIHDGGNYRP